MQRYHSHLLAFLTAAVMLLAMAHYRDRSYPAIIVLDEDRGDAVAMQSVRDPETLDLLFRSGFLEAARIATGSWPYPIEPNEHRIRRALASQFFQENLLGLVQDARARYGTLSPDGAPRIAADFQRITIVQRDGGYYMEAHVTQAIPRAGSDRLRLLHIQALGFLCPITSDNPYNIRMSQLRITEIQPEKEIRP